MRISACTKSYDKKVVLSLPELELPEGQITVLLGANGCGKSTYAKLITGIEKTDAKENIRPDAAVGYMPQKSYAFRRSVKKNIMLKEKDEAKAERLMKALHLSALADQNAQKLSGGETAKMSLARILMSHYDLLILDEPTAFMDMESSLEAESLIREYARDEQCALLLITHSLQQAKRLAQQVLYVEQGELVEAGPADEVLHTPFDARTKKFLEFYS